jgi:hypothetical protein
LNIKIANSDEHVLLAAVVFELHGHMGTTELVHD